MLRLVGAVKGFVPLLCSIEPNFQEASSRVRAAASRITAFSRTS